MPAVARLNDTCTGHGCFPARQNDSGSNNVFVNGRAVHRVGDHWVTHTCVTSHDSTLESGSNSVFINGRACGRIGDPIACGSRIMTGSNNVFAG